MREAFKVGMFVHKRAESNINNQQLVSDEWYSERKHIKLKKVFYLKVKKSCNFRDGLLFQGHNYELTSLMNQ